MHLYLKCPMKWYRDPTFFISGAWCASTWSWMLGQDWIISHWGCHCKGRAKNPTFFDICVPYNHRKWNTLRDTREQHGKDFFSFHGTLSLILKDFLQYCCWHAQSFTAAQSNNLRLYDFSPHVNIQGGMWWLQRDHSKSGSRWARTL